MKTVQSAGTSVIDSSATEARANVLVYARGWNIRPSMPPSAKTGRNDSSMIATENTIGRPTARQAGSTMSRTSPLTGAPPECSRRRCMTFSAMTTDESTSTPIEIAIPASDMALAGMSRMPLRRRIASTRNDESAARGRMPAITSDVLTWSRMTSTQSEAEIIPSTTVPVTVPMAPSISGVRS